MMIQDVTAKRKENTAKKKKKEISKCGVKKQTILIPLPIIERRTYKNNKRHIDRESFDSSRRNLPIRTLLTPSFHAVPQIPRYGPSCGSSVLAAETVRREHSWARTPRILRAGGVLLHKVRTLLQWFITLTPLRAQVWEGVLRQNHDSGRLPSRGDIPRSNGISHTGGLPRRNKVAEMCFFAGKEGRE